MELTHRKQASTMVLGSSLGSGSDSVLRFSYEVARELECLKSFGVHD